MVTVKAHPKFEGVYYVMAPEGKQLATENMVPGTKVYGENLYASNKIEYRAWNPYRSKLGAAIEKGIKDINIKEGMNVLYLGAASGTQRRATSRTFSGSRGSSSASNSHPA
jgi:fibrillarin-like pre-rRNA processing protein